MCAVTGDAAVSPTERQSRRRNTEETRTGATTLPSAAEARTKDAHDDIQRKLAHLPRVDS